MVSQLERCRTNGISNGEDMMPMMLIMIRIIMTAATMTSQQIMSMTKIMMIVMIMKIVTVMKKMRVMMI